MYQYVIAAFRFFRSLISSSPFTPCCISMLWNKNTQLFRQIQICLLYLLRQYIILLKSSENILSVLPTLFEFPNESLPCPFFNDEGQARGGKSLFIGVKFNTLFLYAIFESPLEGGYYLSGGNEDRKTAIAGIVVGSRFTAGVPAATDRTVA